MPGNATAVAHLDGQLGEQDMDQYEHSQVDRLKQQAGNSEKHKTGEDMY